MDLTKEQSELLHAALCDAFNHDSLKQLVMFKLDKEDYNDVAWDKQFATVVFQLIVITEQKGKTLALIAAVANSRPNNSKVKDFIAQHFPQASTPIEPVQQVKALTAGLEALLKLLQRLAAPGIQAIIGRYHADFEITREKIQSLGKYKSLHDHLHQLNFKYIRPMTDAAGLWQQNESQRQLLADYAVQLNGDAGRARQVAQGLRNYRVEKDWIDTLEQAAALVAQAVDAPQVTQQESLLKNGLSSLRQVLKEEPLRINALLCEMAGDLRLGQLIQAMTRIKDALSQMPTSAQDSLSVKEFQLGLANLLLLQPRLAGLVEEHFEWQWLDKEFAAADTNPACLPEERFPRWISFRSRVIRLCDLSPLREWSTNLTGLLKDMEEAAAVRNDILFGRKYHKFRTTAADRFFDVDAQLNDLSDQLIQVTQPLDQLLRMATNGD